MSKVEALVTPKVLGWARERAGLSILEVAKKFKRAQEEIEAWETGQIKPSIAQARRLSELYKRPLAVFYLPEPPIEFDTLRDFRRLPKEDRIFNRGLLELIRTAFEHQWWIKEFMEEEGVSKLPFVGSATINDNPLEVASQILEKFEITPDEQCKAPSRYYALKLWIEKVESKGVFVFRNGSIDLQDCRGFVLSDSIAPFIYLNSDDADVAQLFTLVHEIAHLWLNISGISNLGYIGSFVSNDDSEVEIFCNKVASDALINLDRFMIEIKKLNISLNIKEKIEKLSRVFKVSEEAISRKLLQVKYISKDDYENLREYYQNRWFELKKLEDIRTKEKKGGPSYYLTKVSHNGLLYTQTVIGAYMGGRISGRDASSLLSVKLNNLSKLASQAKIPLTMLAN